MPQGRRARWPPRGRPVGFAVLVVRNTVSGALLEIAGIPDQIFVTKSGAKTPPPSPTRRGPPGRQSGPGVRMDGPRDPLASANSGVARAAPSCSLTSRPEPSSAPNPPMRPAIFEEPICGDPPAGLARSWASKPGPWPASLPSPSSSLPSGGLPGRRSPTHQTRFASHDGEGLQTGW
jgi:hypothetical protein